MEEKGRARVLVKGFVGIAEGYSLKCMEFFG
jgi:hypothetical protein